MPQQGSWLDEQSEEYRKAAVVFKTAAQLNVKSSIYKELSQPIQKRQRQQFLLDKVDECEENKPYNPDVFADERSSVLIRYDPGLSTRNACYLGLSFSCIVGLCLIVWGVLPQTATEKYDVVNSKSRTYSRFFRGTGIQRDLLSLALNVCVTACEASLGMIHGLSLKWALFKEGQLKFNTNIRLLRFSRKSWANSWMVNIVYLLALAVCYTSSAAFLIKAAVKSKLSAEVNLLSTNSGWIFTRAGPLCLGAGILVQCAVCIWCLLTTEIPSWSAHPLNTLAAARSNGLQRQPGRCMQAVHDYKEEAAPVTPRTIQKSALAARKSVGNILLLLVISLLVIISWTSVLLYRRYASPTEKAPVWKFFPFISIGKDGNFTDSGAETIVFSDRDDRGEIDVLKQILFAVILQSVVTVSLHCAELQVLLVRDENLWRDATRASGTDTTINAFRTMISSWQSVTLLVFKPLLNWLLGLAMFITYEGLYMFSPQLVWLCCGWVVFIAFIIYISFQKPRGPQPATYGHLQTLANLVDEWSPTIYWGDKSGNDLDICHAGTSSHRLPGVYLGGRYAGTVGELRCRTAPRD